MAKLIEIFVRVISAELEVIKEKIAEGDTSMSIQLAYEEGEVLITLFLTDDEIKYSLITAVARCLPDTKVNEIKIERKDLISFCLT